MSGFSGLSAFLDFLEFPRGPEKAHKHLAYKQLPSLQSRGPRADPFRAGGPKWGREWPKSGFWPHLEMG